MNSYQDTAELIALYDEEDIKIMKSAAQAFQVKISRIQEIVNFSKMLGFKKIGIAYCTSLTKYALKLEEMLKEDFSVLSVSCKEGKILSRDLFGMDQGVSCNPAFQAKVLSRAKTDLNITMGLCMGHDIIFAKYSKAPITTLLVKDFKHRHSTILEFMTQS